MILNLNNITVDQAQKSKDRFVIVPVNDWIDMMAQKQAAPAAVAKPKASKAPVAKPESKPVAAKAAAKVTKAVVKPAPTKKASSKKSGVSIDDLAF